MMILNLPADLIPLGEEPFRPRLSSVKLPCRIPATCALESVLSLKLPEGYRIAYRPAAATIQDPAFTFGLASAEEPGGLRLTRTMVWHEGVVAPGAYGTLWEAHARTSVPGNDLILLERR
jgi:hypothetical protein